MAGSGALYQLPPARRSCCMPCCLRDPHACPFPLPPCMQGFTSLLPMFSDGTFICWLASNLSGKPLVGANRKPLADAAARTNWLKAIDVLRDLPRMSRR